MGAKIPVVDLKSVGLGGTFSEQDMKEVGQQMYHAFREIGFVYLLSHGIPDQTRRDLLDAALHFFSLPMETKMKYELFGPRKCGGYTPGCNEHLVRSEGNSYGGEEVELKEGFQMIVYGMDLPETDAPEFSRLLLQLMKDLSQLTTRLLKVLEETIFPDRPGLLTSSHKDLLGEASMSTIKVTHYPEVKGVVPPGAVRCGTHSDWGTITLLLQGEVGGLEVRDKTGAWVPAPPVPGAILVNIGDLMEIWSGGQLTATKHRVPVPSPGGDNSSERLSIAFFCQPDDEATVAPPNDKITAYQPVNAGVYVKQKMMTAFKNAATVYGADETKSTHD